jgi:hypothetical protein
MARLPPGFRPGRLAPLGRPQVAALQRLVGNQAVASALAAEQATVQRDGPESASAGTRAPERSVDHPEGPVLHITAHVVEGQPNHLPAVFYPRSQPAGGPGAQGARPQGTSAPGTTSSDGTSRHRPADHVRVGDRDLRIEDIQWQFQEGAQLGTNILMAIAGNRQAQSSLNAQGALGVIINFVHHTSDRGGLETSIQLSGNLDMTGQYTASPFSSVALQVQEAVVAPVWRNLQLQVAGFVQGGANIDAPGAPLTGRAREMAGLGARGDIRPAATIGGTVQLSYSIPDTDASIFLGVQGGETITSMDIGDPHNPTTVGATQSSLVGVIGVTGTFGHTPPHRRSSE